MRRGLPDTLKREARWVPLFAAVGWLANRSISGVLQRLGHPGATLDDAYIHFQYARAFAEGHPFRFQAGEAISTGATSFLWPIVLAPFYLVGFHGESILWPAWLLSYLALGALAYEAHAITLPLTGRAAAIGAGAMVLAFGGFAWCAASGMEVVPFAWLIAAATRRGAEWAEGTRTKRAFYILIALAVAAPLMRPEGAVTAAALGIVVVLFPRRHGLVVRGRDLSRVEGAWFALAALAPNVVLVLLTGHPTSSTAQVKLLPGNPYFSVADAALANAHTLVTTILDGQVWSAEFLPRGGAVLACVGLGAVVWRGIDARRGVRAALVVLLALSMFVPCFYITFLWNRLRYLWPFATGWLIGLACLARTLAGIAGRFDRRAAPVVSGLVAGAIAGTLVVRLDWVLEDVAQSASGIDRQQAALGRWAKQNLPASVRIGVNDTGAIAYFGDRRTFDVVGLTTPTEGRYWVAGAASRLEHYERLRRASPTALPTHFIVYPEWMSCEPVLGRQLFSATVTDSTILGGQTMRVSEARWDQLGTGEAPWTPLLQIADAVDVADLESEAEHGYELLGARDGEEKVQEGNAPATGASVLDGGRTHRTKDRFFVRLPAEGIVDAIVRVETESLAHVTLALDGTALGRADVEPGAWTEVTFPVPAERRGRRTVEVTSDVPVTIYHYWFGPPRAGAAMLDR